MADDLAMLSPRSGRRSGGSGPWPTLLGLAVLASYPLAVRPWLRRWGATESETTRPLPGDELVPSPRVQSTRGVTIRATRAEIWPWLAQMGQGRGGLYSYETPA